MKQLRVSVSNQDQSLNLETDESYDLKISSPHSHLKVILLDGNLCPGLWTLKGNELAPELKAQGNILPSPFPCPPFPSTQEGAWSLLKLAKALQQTGVQVQSKACPHRCKLCFQISDTLSTFWTPCQTHLLTEIEGFPLGFLVEERDLSLEVSCVFNCS